MAYLWTMSSKRWPPGERSSSASRSRRVEAVWNDESVWPTTVRMRSPIGLPMAPSHEGLGQFEGGNGHALTDAKVSRLLAALPISMASSMVLARLLHRDVLARLQGGETCAWCRCVG